MLAKYVTAMCGINLLGLVVLFYFHFSDRERIAYVDSAKIINSYQGMIKARQEYQSKASVWKANIDTLANDVQRRIVEFQKTSARMSVKEKELSRQLIQTKQQQLAEYQRAIQDKAQQEDAAITQKVLDEINAFIKAYGEAHDHVIILAATEQGNIAFARKHLDITDIILEGLNSRHAQSSSK